MKLHVLGSSSQGNCYVLETSEAALVIEAGVRFKEVKKALDFNISKIVGCMVSHSHGDHAGYITDFLDNAVNVYIGQLDGFKLKTNRLPLLFEAGHVGEIGPFKVKPFEVKHDVPCFGFLISHPESGLTLFVTDTHYVPYTFRGLTNIILEVNYSDEILERNIEKGYLAPVVSRRVLSSHMSLDTAKDFLLANDLTAVNNVVLTHLSDGNSNAREFQKEIELLTGKTVTVADKNMIINFDKTPF